MHSDIDRMLKELSKFKGGTTVSFSRVNKMLTCPFNWESTYVTRLPKTDMWDSDVVKIGKFLHEVCEKCKIFTQYYNYELNDTRFGAAWDAAGRNYDAHIVEKSESLRGNTRQAVEKVLRLAGIGGVEYRSEDKICYLKNGLFRFNVRDWKSILWVGVLDVHLAFPAKGTTIIVDYKSHSSDADIENIETKERRQVSQYALLEMYRAPRIDTVTCSISYFGDAKTVKVGQFHRDNIKDLESDFMDFLTEYHEKLVAFNGKEYPAIKSQLCDWCEFTEHCPLKTGK